jgi:histidinol-phosphate aminotransferase
MVAAITDRTRLVLLCTPNNPTGVTIAGADLDRFLAAVPSDVLVVIDEAYLEYATGERLDAIARYRTHPNVCVLRTFSKAYGLAGLRVGYGIATPAVAAALRRTGVPFGVSSIAQAAAIASLDAADELAGRVAAVAAERDRVTLALRALGYAVPRSQANFVWLRTTDAGREQLLSAFDAADILVRGYAGDGVRVTIADAASNDRVIGVLAGLGAVAA